MSIKKGSSGTQSPTQSLLTVPKLKLIAQPLKEVAESKELRVATERKTYIF